MRNNLSALIILIVTSLSWTPLYAQEPQEVLRFGSVAMDIPAVMHRRLAPLTEYLEKAVGIPVDLRLSPNMKFAIEAVANNRVELAYLTPVAYIRSHEMGDTRLIAKMVTAGRSSFRLMIVVREDSPIQHVSELQGKMFALGDPAALLQRAVVETAGMPLHKLGGYHYLGHYDNIVRGILSGDFDAGIVKDTMAYKWQGKGIRIIHESSDLPPYNVVASQQLDDAVYDKLKQAFLALNPANPEHRAVIEALDKKYDGFAETSDAEYDVIRLLVAPYDK